LIIRLVGFGTRMVVRVVLVLTRLTGGRLVNHLRYLGFGDEEMLAVGLAGFVVVLDDLERADDTDPAHLLALLQQVAREHDLVTKALKPRAPTPPS
jgi:hypothetical protein